MAQQLNDIKKRLKSVQSTEKLTSATGLVASVKMQKYKGKITGFSKYVMDIKKTVTAALKTKDENETNEFLKGNDCNNPLHIIFTTDTGLCGNFNNEMFHFIEENIPKDEAIFVAGQLGRVWLDKNEYLVAKGFTNCDDTNVTAIDMLIDNVITLYRMKEISSVDITYTRYVNTLTHIPETVKVLPYTNDEESDNKTVLMEPNQNELLNRLIPLFVSAQIYDCMLQNKASENAAKKNAMDNANKNADKLVEELRLSFNKARQAAITQEMNEIISASEK